MSMKSPKSLIIPIIVVVAIVGALALAVYFSTGSEEDGGDQSNGKPSYDNLLADAVTDEDWKKGAEEPRMTIVVFSDFQCPACSFAHTNILEKLLEEYPDDVRVVFRHYPISSHKLAKKAAEVAEGAGEQGKFWEMISYIFEHQAELTDENILYKWAAELDLDADQIKKDVEDGKYSDLVLADKDSGERSGLTGTPTLYINGEKYEGKLKYDIVKEEIVKHLP
ncbi:DsbA family protein [Patescibacteria group bacterium]